MSMNLYRAIGPGQVHFDFITHGSSDGAFTDEIKGRGGAIFCCPRYKGSNHFAYCKWWKDFFDNHENYKILHSHVRSTASIYINDDMGKYVAESVVKNLIKADKPVLGARVAVLGFTFKENCPDTRNTKVIDMVRELREYGIEPVISDPAADAEEAERLYGVRFCDRKTITGMDAVVLAVGHRAFEKLTVKEIGRMFGEGTKVLLDIKGILNRAEYKKRDIVTGGCERWF